MPEVFPLQDPPPWSLQSAYLGQALLEQHGLRPGEAVVLRLGGGAGLVCRAWLHPVPGVTFVEAATAVVAGRLHPHTALGQLEEIVKLSEVTAKQVEVTVVSLPKFIRKNVSNLVKKMLHNLVLTNNCQVTFSENAGRYGVHSVTVNCEDGAGDAFIVGSETTVKIRNIVSKRRLDLIESVKSEAKLLGGVEDAFKELKSSLLESRSVLVSGPTGCGKSALVTAVLAHLELPGLVTDCSGLASPEPGHTEAAVRRVWAEVEGLGGGALVLDSAECVAGGRWRAAGHVSGAGRGGGGRDHVSGQPGPRPQETRQAGDGGEAAEPGPGAAARHAGRAECCPAQPAAGARDAAGGGAENCGVPGGGPRPPRVETL